MKKFWIITEYYYPNENTTAYIMTKIAEGLGQHVDINIITSTAASDIGIKKEQINNVTIYRVKESKLDKNIFLWRIIKLIILGLRLFIKSANLVKENDTVMVVTNPVTIIFLMRILRCFKKFTLIILVHDIFPENLIVAKVLKPGNFLYKITLKLFNWSYIKADKLVVIGRDMELFMKNKLGRRCPIIFYIPNFVDNNEIKPFPKESNRILKEYNLTDKFIVLYTGNIGRAQDINNILTTMELLKENNNIHLLIIGNGAMENTVIQYVKKYLLSNITLLPSMKRAFSNEFLNAGDVGLVSLQRGRKGIAVPSKTYTFLSAAKPILAVVDNKSEISIMIEESNCGWWTLPGDPQTLKKLILTISNSCDEVREKGENSRHLAEEIYSMEKIIIRFKEIILS